MEEVRVKRSLLVGLVVVAGVALLAVAFILGRTSGSGRPEGIPSPGRTTGISGSEGRSAEEPSLLRIGGESPAASAATAPPFSESGPFHTEDRAALSGAVPAPALPAAGAPTTPGELAAVRAPAPCAVHYQKSLESLDDAVEMLRALESSMRSADPVSGLASVQARASILQARAEALQSEDRALRQRYGLTR